MSQVFKKDPEATREPTAEEFINAIEGLLYIIESQDPYPETWDQATEIAASVNVV